MSVDTVNNSTTTKGNRRAKGNENRNLTYQSDFKTPDVQIEDDLELDLLDVGDIPQDMLFPGEYNVYLQDRLKSAVEENKQLTLLVKEQEAELTSIKDNLIKGNFNQNDRIVNQSSYISRPDSIHYADMAACRVMDLTKQVCELTAELEDQKGRCSIAESKLLSLIGCHEEQQPVSSDVLSKKEGELKALSDKLHATNGKLFECRNRIQQLHQELKNAHKVLICEVGDGVSISELISTAGNSGSWRGRAQQIQVLQQRVIELSDRLRKCCDNRIIDYTKSASGEGKCSIKEKKASLEVAQQETRSAQQQLSEHIRKLDAARARVRVLESEVNSFKGRLEVLADKGVRDGELIHILQGQVCQLEGNLQISKEEARLDLRKTERHYQRLEDDLLLEKQRNIQLLANFEDKEKQLKRLENILFDLKDKEISASKRDTQCYGEFSKVEEVSEALPCPAAVENCCKENKSSMSIECEYKKLLELVGTANRRLNDARHECDKHKSAFRMERQRASRLQAKLARQEMDKAGTSSMKKRQIACNTKKLTPLAPPEVTDLSKEELQDKLELLQEEVLTLKTRLACLEQEKEDDLRSFSSILSNSSHHPLLKQNLGTGDDFAGPVS